MNSKTYQIKLNGKVYELEIEEVDGKSKAPVQVEKKAVKDKQIKKEKTVEVSETQDTQKVEAPMPGTILDISVNIGDVVKSGQTLAVLEAMKMENEIISPVDGKITAINVTKGQNVNTGDNLIHIG